MKYFIISIIIVVSLSIIIAVIISNKNKNDHIVPPTPTQKDKCDISNDPTTLKKCDPNDQDTCNNCANGLHSCFTVDQDKKVYTFSEGNKTVNVPTGNWCLPAKIKNFPCNRFTGYPVLAKLNDTEYAWRCQCKYPNLFNNQGVFGDCINQVACSSQGELVCPEGSNFCKSGDPWPKDEDKSWEPTLGVCKCNDNLKYLDASDYENEIFDKRCVSDTCSPGKTDGDDCNCSNIIRKPIGEPIVEPPGKNIKIIILFLCFFLGITSPHLLIMFVLILIFCKIRLKSSLFVDFVDIVLLYPITPILTSLPTYDTLIRCPKDLPGDSSLCKYSKQCIKDPCNPHGIYDIKTQQCECDEDNGFFSIPSSFSPVKSMCFNPCNPSPCGKRGDCVFDKTTNKASCVNCKSPWFQDDTHMCMTAKQPTNTDCKSDDQCISGNCGWYWTDPAHVGPKQCH